MNRRWNTSIYYNRPNDNPLQFIYGSFLGNLPFVPECFSSHVNGQHFFILFILKFLTIVFQWLNLILNYYPNQKYQKLVLQTPIQMYFGQNLWFNVKLFNDGFVFFFVLFFTSQDIINGLESCGLPVDYLMFYQFFELSF